MDRDINRQTYPEYVTVEQTAKILHLSKRKCSWMLQNGILPCKDSGKKTRQYTIRRDDVIICLENLHTYDMFKLSPDPVQAKELPKAKDIQPKKITVVPSSEPKVEVKKEEPIVIKKPNIKSVIYIESDLNSLLPVILQCLSHISEKKYYGITVLVDVLKGSQSKKIKEAHLDEIPEYAVLQAVNREDLTSMVEWLIDNHFILQTKGAYPVLHPTYDGIHYDETITPGKLKKLLEYLQAKE